jgi:hypothetical protein
MDGSGNCLSTKIPFGSYNRDSYDLGNPYLSTEVIGEMTTDQLVGYYSHSCDGGNPEKFSTIGDSNCPNYLNVDWNFYVDIQYDLRQVLVWFDRSDTSLNQYGRW